jgi:type IV pilus assembly protein PilZ
MEANTPQPPNKDPNRRVLSLAIKDLAVLYTAYMPFIENGGLFIPMKKQLEIGEEVQILLSLMEEPEKIPVAAKVVWVTPNFPQGNRAPGVGVQFREKDNPAKLKIENILAEKLGLSDPTHTM